MQSEMVVTGLVVSVVSHGFVSGRPQACLGRCSGRRHVQSRLRVHVCLFKLENEVPRIKKAKRVARFHGGRILLDMVGCLWRGGEMVLMGMC